jgi:hypothetical protein
MYTAREGRRRKTALMGTELQNPTYSGFHPGDVFHIIYILNLFHVFKW